MSDKVTDSLTPAEQVELAQFLSAAPMPEEKHSVHSFLYKVATSEYTTKLGYLNEEELGMPKLPLRTHKELAVFSKEVCGLDIFADYFNKIGEITTSTSLSKNAKLLELAVINRRQLEDVTKKPRTKRGFFKKRDESEGGEE